MSQLSLTWTMRVAGERQGGKKRNPNWYDIEEQLERIKDCAGTVTLHVVGGPEFGPDNLQVRADQGNYLLTLGELEDGDYHVRSFDNTTGPYAPAGMVKILGDVWTPGEVCTDFNIVRQVFKEFFETGNVSHDLLK